MSVTNCNTLIFDGLEIFLVIKLIVLLILGRPIQKNHWPRRESDTGGKYKQEPTVESDSDSDRENVDRTAEAVELERRQEVANANFIIISKLYFFFVLFLFFF